MRGYAYQPAFGGDTIAPVVGETRTLLGVPCVFTPTGRYTGTAEGRSVTAIPFTHHDGSVSWCVCLLAPGVNAVEIADDLDDACDAIRASLVAVVS